MADVTTAERLGLQDQMAAFNKALLGEDPLGVVIRAHIYIEHQVIEFIRARMSPPEALDALELDYAGRVKLALALGLPAEFKAALSFIGTLRNQFAHRLDAKIDKQTANSFEVAIGAAKAIAHDNYIATKAKTGQTAAPIKQLTPDDRAILYFVTLWSGIAVEVFRARGE
ncbi:hypothetical protein [Xanthobacter autotrophicus]|uniref:hypothetical protein n=1 Tax=Xanthobacter autotrophicus TaxID=280 RepID=UPI003726C206